MLKAITHFLVKKLNNIIVDKNRKNAALVVMAFVDHIMANNVKHAK
jgi:hypothetical protein